MESVPLPIPRPLRSFPARLLRWAIMAVIFAAGGVAGFCVGTMELIEQVTPPRSDPKNSDKFTEWMLGHLKKDLSLTEAQCPRVEKIVRQHHAAFDEIRGRFQPQFEAEMAKMDREMLAVLDQPQQELYKTRMQQRGSNRWGGRGGPNRGGSRRGPDQKDKNHDKKAGQPSTEKAGQSDADKAGDSSQPDPAKDLRDN